MRKKKRTCYQLYNIAVELNLIDTHVFHYIVCFSREKEEGLCDPQIRNVI